MASLPKIHILPEIVANKIAAGEVVERPASIVKELIENSLDAGADRIDVHIEHGGKSLIRVADNGNGMTRDDALLSIQRHATSKIEQAEDLTSIASFGFRGEALPSIAAVSRLKLRTRANGQPTGIELVIEGGVTQSVTECSCREGTIIEVRDLFFNTPARRKFLRGDTSERNYISQTVAHFALADLKAHLALQSNNKQVWQFTSGESLVQRAAQVFGIKETQHLLEFWDESTGLKLSGLVGKPHIARANRKSQVFFVNGRLVKALSLSYALQDGCHGLLMHGQYPLAVVFVDVDPEQVDVNVHPTKQEVRLSNESQIKSLLKKAVTQRLRHEDDMAPFLKVAEPKSVYQSSVDSARAWRNQTEQHAWNLAEVPVFNAAQSETVLPEPISLRNKLNITKVLGQIHQLYIVAETETGVMLIDQHAAHERVMFEELVTGLKAGKLQQQGLLLGEAFKVQPQHQEILEKCLPDLAKLGFDIEPFGEGEYVIRAVPALFGQADPVENIQRFLEQQEAGKQITDLSNHPEEVAALIACKRRSVKGGDTMNPQTMSALLERLARCEYPFSCPHGRPAFFLMNLNELEKQFKRKL